LILLPEILPNGQSWERENGAENEDVESGGICMKQLDFTTHEARLNQRLADFRATLEDLHSRLMKARSIVREFTDRPTKQATTFALAAAAEAETLTHLLGAFEDPERREAGIRDGYVQEHCAELAKTCESFVTERTKTREAYRKTRGAKVAAIVERLTIDDSLSPADRTRIDSEAMVLENELLGAEQTLAAAKRAIADLQREPTFHHFREARDLSANVSFV
jgi:hypothetical protein